MNERKNISITQDRRVRRTHRTLRDQLLKLLKIKPILKITVSELCELADLNRSTFYKYYSEPKDLLRQMANELFGDLEKNLRCLKSMKSLPDTVRAIVQTIYEHRDICNVLFSSDVDMEIVNEMLFISHDHNTALWKKEFPSADIIQLEYLYTFMTKGIRGIIERWVTTGFEQEPRYIAELIESLFLHGANALLKNS